MEIIISVVGRRHVLNGAVPRIIELDAISALAAAVHNQILDARVVAVNQNDVIIRCGKCTLLGTGRNFMLTLTAIQGDVSRDGNRILYRNVGQQRNCDGIRGRCNCCNGVFQGGIGLPTDRRLKLSGGHPHEAEAVGILKGDGVAIVPLFRGHTCRILVDRTAVLKVGDVGSRRVLYVAEEFTGQVQSHGDGLADLQLLGFAQRHGVLLATAIVGHDDRLIIPQISRGSDELVHGGDIEGNGITRGAIVGHRILGGGDVEVVLGHDGDGCAIRDRAVHFNTNQLLFGQFCDGGVLVSLLCLQKSGISQDAASGTALCNRLSRFCRLGLVANNGVTYRSIRLTGLGSLAHFFFSIFGLFHHIDGFAVFFTSDRCVALGHIGGGIGREGPAGDGNVGGDAVGIGMVDIQHPITAAADNIHCHLPSGFIHLI